MPWRAAPWQAARWRAARALAGNTLEVCVPPNTQRGLFRVLDQWCSDFLLDRDTLALEGAASRTFWVVYFTVVV